MRYLFLFVIACVLSAAPALAGNVTWTNASGGNWSNSGNRDTGTVPGPADDVFIELSGTFTVTLDIDADINSLSIGGAGGAQTMVAVGRNLSLAAAGLINTIGILQFTTSTIGGTGVLTNNVTQAHTISATFEINTYVIGANGHLCYSVNGGLNWTPESPGITETLTSVSFANPSFGFAVGANGTIYHWNGTSWIVQSVGSNIAFQNVYAIGDVAYAVGFGGAVWFYNGVNWAPLSAGITVDLYALHFFNQNFGYAVGAGDVLTYCSQLLGDGDPTNDRLVKKLAKKVNKRKMIKAGQVPAGNILYKGLTGSGFDWSFGFIPEQFEPAQNYPNPFNPVTHINFALPEDSHVTVTVYDILGHEVLTLVNGFYTAGRHQAKFDDGSWPRDCISIAFRPENITD